MRIKVYSQIQWTPIYKFGQKNWTQNKEDTWKEEKGKRGPRGNSFTLLSFSLSLSWPCQYAVKAQTSLAPLSRFRGSRVTAAHAHQCCRFQSYAKTVPARMKLTIIDNEIDKAWTNIPGIHDNGPRDHGVWRRTLKIIWSTCNMSLTTCWCELPLSH